MGSCTSNPLWHFGCFVVHTCSQPFIKSRLSGSLVHCGTSRWNGPGSLSTTPFLYTTGSNSFKLAKRCSKISNLVPHLQNAFGTMSPVVALVIPVPSGSSVQNLHNPQPGLTRGGVGINSIRCTLRSLLSIGVIHIAKSCWQLLHSMFGCARYWFLRKSRDISFEYSMKTVTSQLLRAPSRLVQPCLRRTHRLRLTAQHQLIPACTFQQS